jgi:hypothetical protein
VPDIQNVLMQKKQEILMEEDSDEELEELKLCFMLEDPGIHQRYSISLVPQVESTDQLLPI